MRTVRSTPRVVASALLFFIVLDVVLSWGLFLFAVDPENWRGSLAYVFAAENLYRTAFAVTTIGGVFSAASIVVVMVSRRRAALRGVFAGAIGQMVAFLVVGIWYLAFIAALPLWWLNKVQHEV